MLNSRSDNKLLKLPDRVIFLHIPRTAGTSIVTFFKDRMPADKISSHGDFLKYSGSQAERADQLKKFQFLSGHFGYTDVASLLDESYSFTFLRDPVDRVLSGYKLLLWPAAVDTIPVARIAAELGLEGFLTSTLPEVNEVLNNQQTWQLARSYWQEDREALKHLSNDELLSLAIDHLEQFNLVGVTETFDADFGHVLKQLGIKEPVPKGRGYMRTLHPIHRRDLSPSVLATLKERLALDYALVDYVRDKRMRDAMPAVRTRNKW